MERIDEGFLNFTRTCSACNARGRRVDYWISHQEFQAANPIKKRANRWPYPDHPGLRTLSVDHVSLQLQPQNCSRWNSLPGDFSSARSPQQVCFCGLPVCGCLLARKSSFRMDLVPVKGG